ncbi:hypothetical protein NEQG_00422 [Nematocida parisii ERTm3]|uniref:XPG N-terminal domain-containing protein n=1 Tax=Nematocida parisii (strain ERTm3) TaxID=935791 RepID=I3EKA5_NEMP3|nr:hypothetical protein NEQG_00422 [Nematocida parisii ERTm3]
MKNKTFSSNTVLERMGIKNIWKMLSGRTLELRELNGLTMCVDGNLALFPCICNSNIVFITEYTLKIIHKLITLGIDPIFVFDGKRPLFKKRQRREDVYIAGQDDKQPQVQITHKYTETEELQRETENEESKYLEEDVESNPSQKLSDRDFSQYQVQKVYARYKYLKSVSKTKRMHGDSSLLFNLNLQSALLQKEEEASKEADPFKEVSDHIDQMKSILYKQQEVINAEESSISKKKSCIGRDEKKPASIHSVIIPNEQTEYQRELKMYDLPKEDTMLSREAVDKDTLPLSYRIIVDIFDAFSIKYAIAPSESDNVYKSLEKVLNTDGVITEDSDMLIFSTKPVFRHVFKRALLPKVFAEKDTVEYTQTELHILAWLLGNDYVPGVSGVGPAKAKQIIQRYRETAGSQIEKKEEVYKINIDVICDTVSHVLGKDISEDIPRLLQVQRVYADREFKVYIENLHPKPYDKKRIIEFLTKRTTWESEEKEGYFKMVSAHQESRNIKK